MSRQLSHFAWMALVGDTINKANALNNYFQSIFTKENLTNIPSINGCDNLENPLPTMSSITVSVAGIQHQLSLFDTNKNCANDIAPIATR